jgi:hypothetical protein
VDAAAALACRGEPFGLEVTLPPLGCVVLVAGGAS